MGKTSAAVKNRWAAKAYDQVRLQVPKGQKATIEAAAQSNGESVNAFIQRAILARLGLSEWPTIDAEPEETEEK